MIEIGEAMVAAYYDWLRAKTRAVEMGGAVEITAPFLDRHNDYIRYYIQQVADGLRLTDDGAVIGDLEASGVALDTDTRRLMLAQIIRGFGVKEVSGELVVEATENDLPRRQHALLQSMIAVNNLAVIAKPHVQRLFREDVAAYLRGLNTPFTPNVDFVGRSGYSNRFDFVLPPTTSKPERLIRTINVLSKDAVTAALWAWSDVRSMRSSETLAYAIINDQQASLEGGYSSLDIPNSFNRYDMRAVLWSRRNQFAAEFAAA